LGKLTAPVSGDAGELRKHGLDRLGANLVAAEIEHRELTASNDEKAFRAQRSEIARIEPAVPKDPLRFLGIAEVVVDGKIAAYSHSAAGENR
jgi:hypothetical protein